MFFICFLSPLLKEEFAFLFYMLVFLFNYFIMLVAIALASRSVST